MFDVIYKAAVLTLLALIAAFLIYLCWMFERTFFKSEAGKVHLPKEEVHEKVERLPKRTF